MQRNWVFVTNSTFLISISLLPNVVDLWYFRLWNLSLKYQRFTSSDCKDIGIRQFEFVKKKTQFLCEKLCLTLIYVQIKIVRYLSHPLISYKLFSVFRYSEQNDRIEWIWASSLNYQHFNRWFKVKDSWRIWISDINLNWWNAV